MEVRTEGILGKLFQQPEISQCENNTASRFKQRVSREDLKVSFTYKKPMTSWKEKRTKSVPFKGNKELTNRVRVKKMEKPKKLGI